MKIFNKSVIAGIALLGAAAAQAVPVITVYQGQTTNPNLGSFTTIDFNAGTSCPAGVTCSGAYSIGNPPAGTFTSNPGGTGNFLSTVGQNGSLTLTFGSSYNYLGLLWGSVDTYNTLSFSNGTSLTGTQVPSKSGGTGTATNGTQSVYVVFDFTGDGAGGFFNSITLATTQYSFEIDNITLLASETPPPPPPPGVPEPASLALFGLGLMGAAAARRRANKA